MLIMAIDPGYSTGLVVTEDDRLMEAHLLSDPHMVQLQATRAANMEGITVVVEDFIGAGPRTKEAIFVLKLIGGIEALCFSNGTPYVLQTPNTRIPLVPDAKRKAPKGTIIHIIDAYAHALAYWEASNAESK